VHDGKVCFHSLSNFIETIPAKSPDQAAALAKMFGVEMDPEYPNLPSSRDAKRSLIAKAEISREGVKRVSFLPVLIDKQMRPEVLRNGDARFDDAIQFMRWVSEGFSHNFAIDGNEVVVT
jgi:poly-gamma-glutamate synthesis protein (capsule biosynthesis protein)